MDQLLDNEQGAETDAVRVVERKHGLQRDAKGVIVASGERGGLIETDIHKAIDVFFDAYGKVPGQVALREFMKKGSYGPINAALNSWQTKQAESTREDASEKPEIEPLPVEMASVVNELVNQVVDTLGRKLWEAASSSHTEQIAAERRIMEGQLAEMKQKVEQQIETSDALQSLLDRRTDEHDAMYERFTDAQDAIAERDATIEAQKDDLARRDGRIEEIERERDNERAENARLAGALSHSEAENERVKALLQAAEQRVSESTSNAARMREEADKRLADLRETLERERSKSVADLQAADQRERKAAAEIESLKKEKSEFKRAIDLGRERGERDVTEAKAEAKRALAEQAAMFEDRINSAKSEAAAAQKTVSALSEQVEMLKKLAEKPKAEKKPADKSVVQGEAGAVTGEKHE